MTSPLEATHIELGARMTDFAGWSMPLRYGSALDEHHAVRSAAGLFDLSHMGEIMLVGPQAAEALDYAMIGTLSKLAIGQARYTMICNDDGMVIDDLVVYRRGEDSYMVVANASNAVVVSAALVERSADFDAEVIDESLTTSLVAVQGPNAQAITIALTGDPTVADVKYYRGMESQVVGTPAFVARTGYTGEDGFEIYVPPAKAVELWDAALEAGQAHGLVPVGLAARDTLRLEAGMALYGNELDLTITPFDAGAGRMIKFDKPGNFVGRAALEARIDAPHASLIGLEVSGKRPARGGYPVVNAEGDAVGVLTSGTLSPTLDRLIAMARIQPGVEPTELSVDVRGDITPATVIDLPFYKR